MKMKNSFILILALTSFYQNRFRPLKFNNYWINIWILKIILRVRLNYNSAIKFIYKYIFYLLS